MNKTLRNIITLVLISTVITSSSYAGWVDDWVQQKTDKSEVIINFETMELISKFELLL